MITKGAAAKRSEPSAEARQEPMSRPKSRRQRDIEPGQTYGQLLKGLAIGGLLLTGRVASTGPASAGTGIAAGSAGALDRAGGSASNHGISAYAEMKSEEAFEHSDDIKCLATYISIPLPTRTGIAIRELEKNGIDPHSVHEVTVAHKLRGKARPPLLTHTNQTALDIYLEHLQETMNAYTSTGRDIVKMLPKDINEKYDKEFSEFEKDIPRIVNEAAYHIGQNFKSHGISLRADPCHIYGMKEQNPKELGTYIALFPEKRLALAVSISIPKQQISVERMPLEDFESLRRGGYAQHFKSLTARNAAKEIPANLLNSKRLKALGYEETRDEAARNSWAAWISKLMGGR